MLQTRYVHLPKIFSSFTPHPLLVVLKKDTPKVRIHENVHVRQQIEDGWIPFILRYYLTAWWQREYELEAEADENLYTRSQQENPASFKTWAAFEAEQDVVSHPVGYRKYLPWSREPSYTERYLMVLEYMTREKERDAGSPLPWYAGFAAGYVLLHTLLGFIPLLGSVLSSILMVLAFLLVSGDVLARFVNKPDKFVATSSPTP